MPKEVATVFHSRGAFVRRALKSIRWSKEDICDLQEQLSEENPEPEFLFLDFFVNALVNALSLENPVRINWWREHAPNLVGEQWWPAALGYAKANYRAKRDEFLLIDFYERDLARDNCVESLALIARTWQASPLPIILLCWSDSLLRSWQQEGMGSAANREESVYAHFEALGFNTKVVPVTDPMGAILAGSDAANSNLERPSILVLPSFGNDKLVQANWRMKTENRIREALEGYTE